MAKSQRSRGERPCDWKPPASKVEMRSYFSIPWKQNLASHIAYASERNGLRQCISPELLDFKQLLLMEDLNFHSRSILPVHRQVLYRELYNKTNTRICPTKFFSLTKFHIIIPAQTIDCRKNYEQSQSQSCESDKCFIHSKFIIIIHFKALLNNQLVILKLQVL